MNIFYFVSDRLAIFTMVQMAEIVIIMIKKANTTFTKISSDHSQSSMFSRGKMRLGSKAIRYFILDKMWCFAEAN